ncbi:helix-hairpin-helix domain-containing protein [Nocardioides sp. GY 10127]|uniref:helix-hairpin-helix domain-containing protein n=1 Tax=Nocardioides sp. GY 10127 TaxID=2569762 RepID=UPI0010A88989|nr:helix-hairpin-helix domain-containing protein [Nocardioides sp. GY 10127]TIC83999.1 ComEA family DNA-binding protein [Nocardioides sp. GY 10127]
MRTRRPSPEHAEALARRLAHLAGAPGEPGDLPDPADPAEPAGTGHGPGLPLPVPGRHRSGTGLAAARTEELRRAAVERVREHPAGRLASGLVGGGAAVGHRLWFGAAQVAVLAGLVAAALVVATWWVVRSDPRPTVLSPAAATQGALAVASSSAEPSSAESSGSPAGSAALLVTPAEAAGSTEAVGVAGTATGPVTDPVSDGATGEVVVDVAGRVRRPGIVVLPAGSRVADALAEAGGARPRVDLTSLNLARVLVDGEQVLVGVQPAAGATVVPAPGASVASGTTGTDSAAGALVNLNTADQALLETLPQVGPVTAAAILAWREENGAFTSVDQLLDVSGIGEATLATVRPHVTV